MSWLKIEIYLSKRGILIYDFYVLYYHEDYAETRISPPNMICVAIMQRRSIISNVMLMVKFVICKHLFLKVVILLSSEVIVSNLPDHIIDHIECGNLDLFCCDHVVIDEADEKLKRGFTDDVMLQSSENIKITRSVFRRNEQQRSNDPNCDPLGYHKCISS